MHKHINLLSFDMLCSACYDNLVTYLNKFLHQKADVCLNKTQISTLLAVLQIHDTSNTRTGREVLLDKFLSPEPSLWKFFTDFDRLCFFFFPFFSMGVSVAAIAMGDNSALSWGELCEFPQHFIRFPWQFAGIHYTPKVERHTVHTMSLHTVSENNVHLI